MHFFKESCRNINKTWREINRLISNESKSTKISQLEQEDTLTTDAIEISNIRSNHFSQIGPSLASQIQDISSKYTDYITPTEQIFSLQKYHRINSEYTNVTKQVAWIIFLRDY